MNILCLTTQPPKDFRIPPGIDLIEWRIDDTPLDEDVIAQLNGQWLATLRHSTHGGGFNGSDAEREEILLKSLDMGASWVDVEAEFDLGKIPVDKTVRSVHLQSNTRDEIEASFKRMMAAPGAIKKWVRPTPYTEDLCDEEKQLIDADVPAVIIHSAAGGQWSRARPQGHPWNYLPIDTHRRSGEGQLTWAENIRLGQGKLYGIIGNPLDHSLSPLFHNRMRRVMNLGGGFVKVPLEDTDVFFKSDVCNMFSGFSVTMPHKANVIRNLNSSSDAVKQLGACNTLTREEDGSFSGENTDYLAVKRAIEDNRQSPEDNVAVIGVGGFGRAAAVAALHAGHPVTLFNRTKSTADEWAQKWNCESGNLDNYKVEDFPIVVQATSAEMSGDCSPIDTSNVPENALLIESLYGIDTEFLNKAPASCNRVGGKKIFQYQAQEQIRIWTGQRPEDNLSALTLIL